MKFNPNETVFFENKEYHDDELLKSYQSSRYDWDPSMIDSILRVSKSSLGTHGFCQYQYKLQYIHQIPVDENYTMIRGTNVHAIVEYFWDHVDEVLPQVLEHISKGNEYAAQETLRSVIPKPPEPYLYGEEAVMRESRRLRRYSLIREVGDAFGAIDPGPIMTYELHRIVFPREDVA